MAERLGGGNMNDVVRVGDTVRRIAGPWTPTVHRLLRHLRAHGFGAAAAPLGVDGEGREVLEFLPGEVPVYPLPEWVWRPEQLTDAGRLLRAWHDASAGFDTAGAVWQSPAREPAEVICHRDFAPHNLVFDARHRLTGVIDVDFAAPGPRVWDLAYLATRIVPLSSEHEPAWSTTGQALARLRRLLDAYGWTGGTTEVLEVAHERLVELAAFSDAKADELHRPALHDDADLYRREAAWLRDSDLTRPRD